MAPQGSARARRRQEAVPSRHLQRDHQERSSQGRCRAARHRHAARRRAAGAQDPRPHCRLQGVAAPLEEHRVRQQPLALRGPRPVCRAAAPRRAPARDRGVQARDLLPHGRRGEEARLRERQVRRETCANRRREAERARPPDGRHHASRPLRRRARGRRPEGPAEDAPRAAAVHHVDDAAGGVERPFVLARQDDEACAVALRAGAHHLHANRLRERVRAGARGGEGLRDRDLRRGVLPRKPQLLQVQGRRAGRPRGDTPDRCLAHAGPRRRERHGRGGAQALRTRVEALRGEPDGRREDDRPHRDACGPQARARA